MTFIRYFGVDFTEIKNVKLISIKKRVLEYKNQENTSNRLDQTGITTYVKDEETEENLEVSFIKIQDNNKFMDFVFGVNYVKKTKKVTPFINISMSISQYEEDGERRGNNFKPLTMKEYRKFVYQVKDYLYEEYGILVDVSMAQFEQLEIADTFFLDRKYREYRDTLKAMYLFAPNGMKKQEKGKKKDAHGFYYDEYGSHIETMKLGNGSIGIIAYNKSKQTTKKYGIDIDLDAMRIEAKIKNGTRCNQIFNGKTIFEITDEDLKEYYIKRVEKDLFKGVDDYIKKGNKLIKEYMKEEKEYNPRGWTQKSLSMAFNIPYSQMELNAETNEKELIKKDISIAFDVWQVLEIMRKEMKRKSVYDTAVKRMKRDIELLEDKKNNLSAYQEIKIKVFGLN